MGPILDYETPPSEPTEPRFDGRDIRLAFLRGSAVGVFVAWILLTYYLDSANSNVPVPLVFASCCSIVPMAAIVALVQMCLFALAWAVRDWISGTTYDGSDALPAIMAGMISGVATTAGPELVPNDVAMLVWGVLLVLCPLVAAPLLGSSGRK